MKSTALGVIILVIALAVCVGFYVEISGTGRSQTTIQSSSQASSSSPTLANVNVFGLASTVGQGSRLVALSFTSTITGTNLTAPVSNGGFSINLPNGAVYDVVARWAGNYSWQSGSVDRGDLTVNMSAGSMGAMSYNVQVETPPTILVVHGIIGQTLTSAQPFKVVFTAPAGESFNATIQNGSYSARLPNMMDYQVKVFWQYADGTTDYYFVNDLTVNEGLGVVGLDVVTG